MAIQIKLKNSVVQDSTPSASDLPVVGELALNANINSIGGFMRASDNSIVKIFGPGSVTTPTATTTVSGIAELATNSETTTGTATNRVVTPAGLNAVTTAERTTSNTNYVAKAGSTLTGVLTMPNGSNSAPAINFGDSDSGIFGGTNTVSLAAGGTTRLTADTGVSITGALGVTGNISNSSGQITCGVTGTSGIQIINDGTFGTLHNADLVLRTHSTERARLDTSGRLLVGTPAARSNFFNTTGTHFPRLQVESANNNDGRAALALTYGIASALGPYITLSKHRSNVVGANGIVLENDEIGLLSFQGNDGAEFVECARITGNIDGTPGSDDMPGRLVFSTTADGQATPTPRLTIDSAGLVKLPDNGKFVAGAGLDLEIFHNGTNSHIRNQTGDLIIDSNSAGSVKLRPKIGEEGVVVITDGATELYFDGSKKLETSNTGVSVTGAIAGTAGLSIEGATVFNDAGADVDFRVEGDTDANLLNVDAGNDFVNIGSTTNFAKFGVFKTVASDAAINSANAHIGIGSGSGSGTVCQSILYFAPLNGSGNRSPAAITAVASGNTASDISFHTNANSNFGQEPNTKVMTLTSTGRVGIGIDAGTNAKLHVVEAASIPAVKIKCGLDTNQNASMQFLNDNEGGILSLGVFGSSASTFGANEAF